MPQVVVAAAAYYASGVVAEYAAFELLVGAAGSAFLGAAAGALVTVAGTAITNSLSGSPTADPQERKQTIRQPAASRRVLYGQVKAGGILVYASGTGGDGYAHLIIAVAEGEIEGFDPVIWIGDTKSDDPKFSGLVDLHFHTGASDQEADPDLMAARPGEWTADHRLRGIAYVYVRLKKDANAFPGGLPQLAFLPKGRKVFDPRTGLRAWSENPALCILDYLRTDPRAGQYFSLGMDAPDTLIDFDSFAAAANVCDELVTSLDPANMVDGVPGRVKRYTLNGIVDLGGSPASIVEEMQSACGGRLVFSQGKYRFYAGAFDLPVGTITGDMLRADPSIRMKPGRQQIFNIVRGKYVEPRQDWSETDYAPRINAAAIAADGGSEIVQELRLPFTTNGATAQRLSAIALAKIRIATSLNLQCNWSAVRFRIWDVVTIDIPEIHTVGVPFRILEFAFAEGGGIDLVLQREAAENYAWNPYSDEVIVKDVIKPAFNDEPPDPVTDLFVSGIPRTEQYGTVPQITATWSYPESPFFMGFEVESKLTSEVEFADKATVTERRYVKQAVTLDESYDLRVRVVNRDSRHSEWAEVDGTVAENDMTAPGIPIDLSVSGSGTHTVQWKTPDADDFKKSNVYQNSSNSPAGATMFASIVGLPLTTYSASNTPGGTRFYFVSSVDRTGNESPLTYAGTGT